MLDSNHEILTDEFRVYNVPARKSTLLPEVYLEKKLQVQTYNKNTFLPDFVQDSLKMAEKSKKQYMHTNTTNALPSQMYILF